MKIVSAFLRLVRWPNLVFIALTQVLFYYSVIVPVFSGYAVTAYLEPIQLMIIIAASVFIAAGGYIINDYFDLNIDMINKPQKLVVEKIIKRRSAILWHLLFSFIGLILSFYGCISLNPFYNSPLDFLIGFVNFACIIGLWIYSTTYKRKLLVGNVLISLLTAWTIFVLYFASFPHWFKATGEFKHNYNLGLIKLFKLSVLYGAFAFVITLIREVIKDMEDRDGDEKNGCKTMPIVWGIPATKIFVAVWLIVLLATLTVLQLYVMQFNWWISIAYCVILIITPLVIILKKLKTAQSIGDYRLLSKLVKLVILTGILSMIFFRIYA